MTARSTRFHNRNIGIHKRGWLAFFQARSEKGIALLTSLMLLTLMSAMGLVMVMTVAPDMLVNGYYGNFRGSFYAADSGLNMARQQLVNQMQNQVNMAACTGWVINSSTGCSSPPLATSAATTVLNNVLATSGGYGSFTSLNSGQAASSWPGSFQIVNTSTCANSFAIASGSPTVTATNSLGQNSSYQYQFNYKLCAIGRALSSQQVQTMETGAITVNITAQTTSSVQTVVSFSAFADFIDNFSPCTGPLVYGTTTGPMFTNGAWQFGDGGTYIFTDPVSQANSKADYYINGNCNQAAATSYTSGGTKVAPNFQAGLNLGQPTAPLPPNDFSQKWAVLDGIGCGASEGGPACGSGTPPNPTTAQLIAKLADVSGNPYTSSTTSGVFLPYSCVGSTCTMNGGGIYVERNSSLTTNVVLTPGTDGSGNLTQIYTITQGGSTTTTITTNPAANTTTIVSGSKTKTLIGVPMNRLLATPTPATMLYVDGPIDSLSGPTGTSNQGKAAIQDDAQITVAAAGDVKITGDIIYKTEPVTLNTADTLQLTQGQPGTNQVLGVFSNSGNIDMRSPYSNNNLQMDGSYAAVGQSCASNKCGFTTASDTINTVTTVGGWIHNNIFGANVSTKNIYFDRRFTAWSGFAPPWFPSTTLPKNDVTTATSPLISVPPPNRLSWSTTPQ